MTGLEYLPAETLEYNNSRYLVVPSMLHICISLPSPISHMLDMVPKISMNVRDSQNTYPVFIETHSFTDLSITKDLRRRTSQHTLLQSF